MAMLEPFAGIWPIAVRMMRLNQDMQQLFVRWRGVAAELEHPLAAVNLAALPPICDSFDRLGRIDLHAPMSAWDELFEINIAMLERFADAQRRDAAADLGS
jgi:hypothetical protein